VIIYCFSCHEFGGFLCTAYASVYVLCTDLICNAVSDMLDNFGPVHFRWNESGVVSPVWTCNSLQLTVTQESHTFKKFYIMY